MTPSQPSRDSDGGFSSTIIEFDENGRVIRIPGIYPEQEKVMSFWSRPIVMAIGGALLFVVIGLLVPVFAKVIGVVDSAPGRIEISDESGICMGAARSAAYVAADGTKTPGCWTGMQGGVFVVFLDGEIARIPMSAIRPPTNL